jgi:hypothetical protein
MRVHDETVETPGETGAWSRGTGSAVRGGACPSGKGDRPQTERGQSPNRLLTDRAGEPARWAASDSQPSLS